MEKIRDRVEEGLRFGGFADVCFRFLEDLTLEEEAERKIGWMLKLFFAGTATYVGYQFFPYMGMCASL